MLEPGTLDFSQTRQKLLIKEIELPFLRPISQLIFLLHSFTQKMRWLQTIVLSTAALSLGSGVPPPPKPEQIEVTELPLPPVAPNNDTGACTAHINPRHTGCIGKASDFFQAGDFAPHGKHVTATVEFIGAPPAPHPGSTFTGKQLILIKTDGKLFENGDPWKCECILMTSIWDGVHLQAEARIRIMADYI